MSKASIDLDEVWPVYSIKKVSEELKGIEVSEEALLKYERIQKEYDEMQRELKKLFEDQNKNNPPVTAESIGRGLLDMLKKYYQTPQHISSEVIPHNVPY